MRAAASQLRAALIDMRRRGVRLSRAGLPVLAAAHLICDMLYDMRRLARPAQGSAAGASRFRRLEATIGVAELLIGELSEEELVTANAVAFASILS